MSSLLLEAFLRYGPLGLNHAVAVAMVATAVGDIRDPASCTGHLPMTGRPDSVWMLRKNRTRNARERSSTGN